MKNLKFLLTIFFTGIIMSACAQNNNTTKTTAIKVYGNCDMCKKRIDNAAAINGVKKADWNADKKILTLKYDSTKTNTEVVEKAIAAKGYDTEHIKADDKAYSSLPECCQYERRK